MNAFTLSTIPRTFFGLDTFQKTWDIVSDCHAQSVLLVTGHASFVRTKYYPQLINQLNERNVAIMEARVGIEPSPELIDQIVMNCRPKKMDMVIAVGGGSVIDAGKAISAMLPMEDSVLNYLEGVGTKNHPGTKIPMIAIPTTSGTGSEATKNAVLSKVGENGYKKSLRHDCFIPDYAVIDPMLTMACPRDVTAASGMDALNQLLESYLSSRSNPYTDALAISGIEAVYESLERLCTHEGANLDLRGKMAYAAYLSGITLANAGLGIVHGFASSIGGMIDIPHGVLCGKLNGPVMKTVMQKILENDILKNQYQVKLIKLCQSWGIVSGSLTQRVAAFNQELCRLEAKLNLPRLSHYGLTNEMAEIAAAITSCKESPVKLSTSDLSAILHSIL